MLPVTPLSGVTLNVELSFTIHCMLNTSIRTSVLPYRVDQIPYKGIGTQNAGVTGSAHPFINTEATLLYEEYTPNSGGTRRDKPFQHYKCKSWGGASTMQRFTYDWWSSKTDCAKATLIDKYAGATAVGNGWYAGVFGDPGKLDSGLTAVLYAKTASGDFIPPPTDLEVRKQQSLNVMLPYIKSELSLVNSIIELKDFKRPMQALTNAIKTGKWYIPLNYLDAWAKFRRARTNIKNVAMKFRNEPTMADVARMVSAGYLEYSFNLAPLVSDISAVRRAISGTIRRVNDLVTRVGRVQRKHYAFVWKEFEDQDDLSAPYAIDAYSVIQPTGWIARRQVRYDSSVFHAEVEYNYNFTRYTVAIAQLSGMLDALGVQVNPAIIWNAIPFSFVVDWVFGVSRWLDQFKVSNMAPQINIRSYLWSVKRRRQIMVWCKHNTVPVYYPTQFEVLLPVNDVTTYRRDIGMPSSSSVQLSGLNLSEFSLGAALVIALRRRQTRKVHKNALPGQAT